jgi:phosphate starvation-inducible PhoH-like protein
VEVREILRDVRGIAFTEFGNEDVVRHPLVARIIEAYDRYQGSGIRDQDGA